MRIPLPVAALLPALLLPCSPQAAQPAADAAQPAPEPATLHMSYTGLAFGLSVLKVDADLDTNPTHYRVDLRFHTVGLLAVFVSSEFRSTTWGSWRNGNAEPERFWSWGHLRGAVRETLIDYEDGRPRVDRLIPSNPEDNRDPVPEAEVVATIDTLSALAFLLNEVARSDTCQGSLRVFDGHRLTEIDAHPVGDVRLPPGDAGPWQGEALQCDFAGRELAGFKRDGSAWQHQPHAGKAWLARVVPGEPPIPVRLNFGTRWLNDITLVLTEAGPGPLPDEPR